MLDKSAKSTWNSWEVIWGNAVVPLTMAFLPINFSPDDTFTTGGGLIIIGGAWISFGILPLYVENRTTPVFIAGTVIITVGSSIVGFGIATFLKSLFFDIGTPLSDSWVSGVARILVNLALLAWGFVILKIAPVTRSLIIGTVFLMLAGSYSLGCGIFLTMESVVNDTLQVAPVWEDGIATVLNGSAMVAWTLLITRKTVAYRRIRLAIPFFIICGCCFIGIGIWDIVSVTFSR